MMLNLLDVFRPKRWYRNLFMILGMFIAIKILDLSGAEILGKEKLFSIIISFISLCLVTSANYGINGIFDAKTDSYHPQKKDRAIPSGRISKNLVLIVSIILYILGLILILLINNWMLSVSIGLLILSSIFYNIPPIRLKDRAYADFVFEALNNPIRLMIGWYAVSTPNNIVPASFIFGYWFFGIFLMAAKRFGELRFIQNQEIAKEYRASLAYYTEKSLLMAMIVALVALSYMLGVLSIKYSIDIFMALPLLIIWILWFFKLAYEENTVVKDPERIFEKKPFVIFTVLIAIIFIYLFYSGNQFIGWLK